MSWIGRAVHILSSGCLVLASIPASAQTSATLDQVLAAFRARAGIGGTPGLDGELRQARIDAAKSELGSWSLESEAELSRNESDDERRFGLSLERRQTFGVNANALEARAANEAAARTLEMTIRRREVEREVASTYVDARYYRELVLAARQALAAIEPMRRQGQSAAARGSVGFLVVRRWNLLGNRIEAALHQASAAYSSRIASLNDATGFAIAPAVSTTSGGAEVLAPLPINGTTLGADPGQLLSIQQKRSEHAALAAAESITSSAREVEFRLGGFREIEAKTSGVTFGIGVPLNAGAVAASRTRETRAERELLGVELERLEAEARRKLAVLDSDVKAQRSARALADQRVSDLADLAKDTERAASSGQVASEAVVEVAEELYDARVERAEAIHKHEQTTVEILFLKTDKAESGGKS